METYTTNKHPDSELDYGRNWGINPETGGAGWLGNLEVIVNSTWVITSMDEENPTLEVADQGTSISTDGKLTSIFLKGGTHGKQYILANTIITTDNNNIIRKETKEALLNCNRGC